MEKLEVVCNPGTWLLYHLGAQEAHVSDFIAWFESAKLEKGLLLLKTDVPLKIIKQPPDKIVIKEGTNLTISCEASSFPRPEYQWFKEEMELLVHQEPELFIPSVNLQESGIYICRISKRNLQDNTHSWLFTNSVEVIVTENAVPVCPDQENNYSCLKNVLSLPHEEIPEVLTEEDYSLLGKIEIQHQPQGYAKVQQGFPFYLHCVAVSRFPLKYQWYKNGRLFIGEESSELKLNYMFPDPRTGEARFEYFCEVSNEYDKEFTSVAIVELEEPNRKTRYFAEDKIALLIANDSYKALDTLQTPATDVSDLAKLLKLIHFKVFAFKNLSLIEMEKVLLVFYSRIKENAYALFFFAGHGFEQHGQTYIQPVDCSDLCMQRESICTEWILQNMQESKPALNVLLIDACRKASFWNEPSKIYDAHMKTNTVYGYSTSFLSSSYESADRNSFFVKHLKKYIAQDQSIQDVLMHVQTAFEGERLVRDCQNPVIKTSLSVPRKLRDHLRTPSVVLFNSFSDNNVTNEDIDCPALKSSFRIEMKYMDVFCNGINIGVYIVPEEAAKMIALNLVEINLVFNVPGLQIAPTKGVFLRDIDLKYGSKNSLFKKEIIGTQHLKNDELDGKLVVIVHPSKTGSDPLASEISFSFKIERTWISS